MPLSCRLLSAGQGLFPSTLMLFRITAALLLMGCASMSAQQHDNNWILGENCDAPNAMCTRRVSFEHLPPRAEAWNDQISYRRVAMTCSDSSGHLIFYGNGEQLRNRSRKPMKGSNLIKFGPHSGQAGWAVVPYPGHPNRYCYFHTASPSDFLISAANQKLFATVIDMEEDNGLGAVLAPSDSLLDVKISLLQACKHGNGRDWWIIAPIVNQPKFYTFLLSPKGIEGPFVQDFPISSGDFSDLVFPYSAVALSPDGERLVRMHELDQMAYYGFDRCTGLFEYKGNMSLAQQGSTFFYAAFSPDSRMLYASGGDIYQTDMEAWPRSPVLLRPNNLSAFPDTTRTTQMLLGPDGKIYVNPNFSPNNIGIIHRPDFPELAADFSAREFQVGKLPYGFPTFPNYRLGVWEDSPCDTLTFKGPRSLLFTTTTWSPQASVRPSKNYTVPDLQPSTTPCLRSAPSPKPASANDKK